MAEQKMQLEDWLDDLCVRFIINLPVEDLSSVARICFQVEEAQWFYEDFVRPLDPTLPSMTLRSFSLRIFQHCPLLTNFSVENHTKAFEEFLQYKTRVPVRGAILLNEAMDSTILVKGWKKGANWSFPRGKINKDEDDLECAIREVYEETGYDLHAAGLVPENRDVKYIEVTMREQQLRLYVFRDVPMDTHFQPRTRKEISKIQWYRLSELPAFRKRGGQNQNDAAAAANANKFYMVAPFLVPLKKWVVQQKKKDAVKTTNGPHFLPHSLQDDPVTEDDIWQTELATDISMRTTSLDTLEGATKELQRLLKVQPTATPATLVPVSPDNTGDKGASLLAILQAKNQATAKASPVSQQIPQTPLDATIEDIPQPHSPHGQHHPRQRAPLASYQHPPGFPIAPDATPQSWAFAQPNTVGPVRTQIGLHDAALNHGPAYGHLPPILAHPQPLPPQVQQSYVGSGVAANGTPTNAFEHVQGSGNQRATAIQSQQMHAQSLLYSPKPLAGQLSSQSMALLGVLKSDAKAVSPRAVGAITPNQTVPLGISHEHGVAQRLNGSPGMLLPNPNSTTALPFAASHQRSQQPASPAHRSALLEMFKKPEPNSFHVDEPAELPASTPSAGLLKGISNTRGQVHEFPSPAFQNRNTQPVSSSPLSRPPQGPSDISSQLPMQSLSLQSLAGRTGHLGPHHIGGPNLSTVENGSIYRQGITDNSSHSYSVATQTNPGPLQHKQNSSRPAGPRVPAMASVFGPTGADKPASLASPPAASALPAPAARQRKAEASTEQRQKLLSLFGNPQSPSPGPAQLGIDKGKSTEMGSEMGGKSRVASLASASGQGLPESAPESRRGSQTPISPADRSFLLGYLASVANNGN